MDWFHSEDGGAGVPRAGVRQRRISRAFGRSGAVELPDALAEKLRAAELSVASTNLREGEFAMGKRVGCTQRNNFEAKRFAWR